MIRDISFCKLSRSNTSKLSKVSVSRIEACPGDRALRRRRRCTGRRLVQAPALSVPQAAWAFVPARRSSRASRYSWRRVARRPRTRSGRSRPRPAARAASRARDAAERCRRPAPPGTPRTSLKWSSPWRRKRSSPSEYARRDAVEVSSRARDGRPRDLLSSSCRYRAFSSSRRRRDWCLSSNWSGRCDWPCNKRTRIQIRSVEGLRGFNTVSCQTDFDKIFLGPWDTFPDYRYVSFVSSN